MPDPSNGDDSAPVDDAVLDRIADRLSGSDRFDSIRRRPEYAPASLISEYDVGYYPKAIERASLQIRWYENDDFSMHYAEEYSADGRWACRWDRHPNDHNSRAHFHPPPDAATPGDDRTYPRDWRDVLSEVLDRVDEGIRGHWE